jgi:HK97 gp10 family phage protein
MASTARQRSGLRGVSELRRALKGLPVSMRKEIGVVVADTAIKVQTDMYQFAPKDTGITASHIGSEMSGDKLVARVGMTDLPRGFVAKFIEFGTKGDPTRNIDPQQARPFIAPAGDANETEFRANMREVLRKVLAGSKIGKAFGI